MVRCIMSCQDWVYKTEIDYLKEDMVRLSAIYNSIPKGTVDQLLSVIAQYPDEQKYFLLGCLSMEDV